MPFGTSELAGQPIPRGQTNPSIAENDHSPTKNYEMLGNACHPTCRPKGVNFELTLTERNAMFAKYEILPDVISKIYSLKLPFQAIESNVATITTDLMPPDSSKSAPDSMYGPDSNLKESISGHACSEDSKNVASDLCCDEGNCSGGVTPSVRIFGLVRPISLAFALMLFLSLFATLSPDSITALPTTAIIVSPQPQQIELGECHVDENPHALKEEEIMALVKLSLQYQAKKGTKKIKNLKWGIQPSCSDSDAPDLSSSRKIESTICMWTFYDNRTYVQSTATYLFYFHHVNPLVLSIQAYAQSPIFYGIPEHATNNMSTKCCPPVILQEIPDMRCKNYPCLSMVDDCHLNWHYRKKRKRTGKKTVEMENQKDESVLSNQELDRQQPACFMSYFASFTYNAFLYLQRGIDSEVIHFLSLYCDALLVCIILNAFLYLQRGIDSEVIHFLSLHCDALLVCIILSTILQFAVAVLYRLFKMVLCHFLTSNSFYFELYDRLWRCFTTHMPTHSFGDASSPDLVDNSLNTIPSPDVLTSPTQQVPARIEGTSLATCMSTTASAHCGDLHRTNSLCGAIVSSESSSEIFHSACESTESVTQTNCVKTNREAACTPPILDTTSTSADNSSKIAPSPDVLASPTQPVNPVEGSTLPKCNSVNTDSVNANSHPTNSEGVFDESNIEPSHSVSGSGRGCASASDTVCDASLIPVNTCSGNTPFPELNVSTSPTVHVTPVEKATSPECNSTSKSLFHDIASSESRSKTPCSASESSTLTERVRQTKTNHEAAFTPTTCCTSPNSVEMSSHKTSSPNVPTALIPVTPVEKNTMPKYNSTKTTSKNDHIHLSSPTFDKVASGEGNAKTSHSSSESSTCNGSVIRVKANCKAVSATISISLKEDVLPTSIDNSKNAQFPPSDIATSPTHHNITPVDTPSETQLCCTEEHENKTRNLAIRVSSTQLLPLVTNSMPAGSPTPLLDSSSSLSPVGYIPSKGHSTAIRIIHSTVLNDQSFQLHDSENTANLVTPQSCVVEVFSEKVICRSAQTCETLLRHRSTLLPLILPSAIQSPSEINSPSPTCTSGRFAVYLSSLRHIECATKACLVLQRIFGRAVISLPQFCMQLQSILRVFDLMMCSEGASSVDLSTYNLKSTRSETCSFVSKTTHCILFPTTTNVILHANKHDEVGSSRLIYTVWNIFKQQNILLYYAVGTCCIDKDYFVDVFRDQNRQGIEKARKRKEQRRTTLRPPRHTKSQIPLQIKHLVQFFLIHQTTPISGHFPTNSIQTWSTSSCSLVKDNHTQQQTSGVECSMESCASSITLSPPYSEASEPSSGYTSLTTPANLPAVCNETFFRQTLLPKQEHGEPWDHMNNELVFPRKQISEEQSVINKLSELVATSCFSVSLTANEEAPPPPVWKAPEGETTPTSADNSSKIAPSPDVLASPTQPVNPVEGSTLPKCNSVNTDSVNANSHPTNSEGVFDESNIEPSHSVSGSGRGCASASDTVCDASLTPVNTCSGNTPFPELNVSTSPTVHVTPVEKATSPECNSTSKSLFHDIASSESRSKTPCSASESSTLTERVRQTKTNHEAAFTPKTCCTSPNSVEMSSHKTSSPNVPTALIPVTPVEKNTMPKYNSTKTTSKNDHIHLSSPTFDKVASGEGNAKTSHSSSESSTCNGSVIRVKANCKAVSATISISLKEDVLPTSIDNSKNAQFPPSDIATSPTHHNITPVDTPSETQLCCTEEHENKTRNLAIRVSSTQLLPLVTNSMPAGSPTPLLDSSSSLSPVGYIPSKGHSTAIRIIHSTVLNDQSFQLHDSENTANLVTPQSCVVEVFSEKVICRSAQTCETLLRHRSTLLPLILPSAIQSPSEINSPSPTCTSGRFAVYLSSLRHIECATKACLVLQRIFGRAVISLPQFCMQLQSILRVFDLMMCSEGASSVDLSTYNLKSTRSETCSFVSKTTHCILFPTTTNVILHANKHDEVGSSRLIYTVWNIFKQQNILLYYAVGTCCIDKDYFVDVFRDQNRQGIEKARKRKEQRRITLRPPRHTKSQIPLQIKHLVQFFLIHQTTPISGHFPTNSIQTWSTSSCSLVKDNHTQQQTSGVECSMESCASSITLSPPYSDQASVILTEADTFKLSQTEASEPSSGYTSLTTPNHSTMLSEDDQNSQTSANLPAVCNETFFRQTLLPKQEHGEPWDHMNNELVFPRKQISEEQSAINKLSELVATSCFSVSLTANEEAPPLPVWKAPEGETIEGDISDSKGKSSDLKYFNNDEGQVKADPLQSTETEYFDEAHYTNNSIAYTGTKSDYLLKPVLEVFSYNAEQQHPTELCKLDSCNDLGKSALTMDQLAFMPCPIIPFRALCGNDSDTPTLSVDNVSHLTSNSLLLANSNALDHQFHCVQDLETSCQPATR